MDAHLSEPNKSRSRKPHTIISAPKETTALKKLLLFPLQLLIVIDFDEIFIVNALLMEDEESEIRIGSDEFTFNHQCNSLFTLCVSNKF